MSALALAGVLFGADTSMVHAEGRAEARQKLGSYFAASRRNAAFPVRMNGGNTAILLLDFETGNIRILTSANSHMMSPHLSLDGERLLFVRHPYGRRSHELIACGLRPLTCKLMLKSADSIGSPIEVSGGQIMYASSPLFTGADGRDRYSRNDFWLLGKDGRARPLTDFNLYELTRLSVTQDSVYFSAFGASPDKPIIPRIDSLSKQSSDIYRLPFDASKAIISPPKDNLSPLFEMDGRSTRASISVDGALIALLNADTRRTTYRYDLVILDQKGTSNRRVESMGAGFSQPIVLDDVVVARDLLADRHLIKRFRRGVVDVELLAVIHDAAIDRLETIELQIKSQEGALP